MFILMYLWCGFIFFAALIVKAIQPSFRRHEPIKLVSYRLNVSCHPVALSDLKRIERCRELAELSGEMLRVSKLIDIHCSRENLPADGLPRLCARQEALRVRFRNLMEGDFGLNEMEFIPPRESMVRVKALPARSTLRVRARHS